MDERGVRGGRKGKREEEVRGEEKEGEERKVWFGQVIERRLHDDSPISFASLSVAISA